MQLTGKEVPHNPSWPLPLQLYVVAHFLLVVHMYHNLFEDKAVRIGLTLTLTLSRGKIFNVSWVFYFFLFSLKICLVTCLLTCLGCYNPSY